MAPQVLIVDDEPEVRESLVAVLQAEGYRVFSAANGREGLAFLTRGHRIDVILLDLIMPVMNGWDFLAAQQGDPVTAAVPVVVFSVLGLDDGMDNPLGVAAYFSKPVTPDTLLPVVRGLLPSGTS